MNTKALHRSSGKGMGTGNNRSRSTLVRPAKGGRKGIAFHMSATDVANLRVIVAHYLCERSAAAIRIAIKIEHDLCQAGSVRPCRPPPAAAISEILSFRIKTPEHNMLQKLMDFHGLQTQTGALRLALAREAARILRK